MARVRTLSATQDLGVEVARELYRDVGELIAITAEREIRIAQAGEIPKRPWALRVDGRPRAPNAGSLRRARRRVQVNFLDSALAIGIDVVERFIRRGVYRHTRQRTGTLATFVIRFNGREYSSLGAVPDLRSGDRASIWLTADYAWIVNHYVAQGTGRGFAGRIARVLRRRRELQGLYIRAVFRRNPDFVGGWQPGWYFRISRLLAYAQRRNRIDR